MTHDFQVPLVVESLVPRRLSKGWTYVDFSEHWVHYQHVLQGPLGCTQILVFLQKDVAEQPPRGDGLREAVDHAL